LYTAATEAFNPMVGPRPGHFWLELSVRAIRLLFAPLPFILYTILIYFKNYIVKNYIVKNYIVKNYIVKNYIVKNNIF
jgi:hypothetical protein